MRVRFLPEAETELGEAVAHYEVQLANLGTDFAAEVRTGLTGKRIRRYRLNRFPYGILYAVLDDEIVVVAVMHLHRKPDYWQKRTPEK